MKRYIAPIERCAKLRASPERRDHGHEKQWTGGEKLAIVLEGLKGECLISELCNEHGISQGMYYKWRDQLLTDGAKLFEHGGVDNVLERLERETRKLKDTIVLLTVVLKKVW